MLMDHFLTPNNDLQEIPLSNAEFSWFPDGSYLKEDNDKYCAGYAIGGRRQWQPTPVLLPGKSHGQRSLVGYSPWGR